MEQSTASLYLSVKDHLVTGEAFDLVYNSEGDMLITSPQPSAEDLPKYYKSDQYISHTDSEKGLVASLYQFVKRRSIIKKVKLITKLNGGPGRLADLGAGTGSFLEAAKNANWEIFGSEPDQDARKLAAEKGIELTKNIEGLNGSQFEVVTLWHVLEHIPDLQITVDEISDLVSPGGYLVVAVPNYKCFDAKFYKEYWAAFDAPRHLWHFSKSSIKRIFSRKLDFVNFKPMLYDSFYVSLLSEKYKHQSNFSPRAIIVGLWSNIHGFLNKEYSSHIYIFRKPK